MRINECCLKDIKAREAKLQEVAESRAGFVGAAILLILYGIVSNMEYYDCVNLGGVLMSYKVLNDAVGLIRDETPMWEGSYQELPDKTKDGLIALWLITHPTWMDDVFPHTVSDKPLLALEAIYSEDATSRMAAAMFRDAADRNAKDVDNDAYLSEALDDFEAILDTPDFLEEIRHQLYMYLEPSMEELVMDSFQDLNHLDRLVMGSH